MKNLFKNQFLSEKTFRKWFINSFLIILTFIVSGILLYLGALAVTKHAVLLSQEQSAEHIKELIDIELLNLKKDISVLSLNDRLLSAAYIGRPSTGNDYYNYHKAGKELMGIYFYKNVQDIYVYYKEGDCFVGCYNLIGFDNKAFTQKHFGMSRKEWKSFAAGRLTSSFLKLKNTVYFLCPLKKDNSGAVTSLAIAELDEKKLKQLLPAGNAAGEDESCSYIISRDGSLITSTLQSSEIKYGYGTLKQGENYIDDTVVTCKRIENTDWEYIGIVPVTQYLKEIYNLRYILYIYIGVILFLALPIVYYETRRRYQPVQSLQKNIQAGGSKAIDVKAYNEIDIFSHLQKDILDIMYDNTNLKSRLKKEKDTLSAKKFSELMIEDTNVVETGHYFYDNFSLQYKQGIVVIISEMSAGTKLTGLSAKEHDNILLLCLNNIGSELYGEHYKCYFWRYVEITGVIWTDQEEISAYLNITNVLEQMRACIMKYFEIDLRFAISGLYPLSSGLAAVHNEAKAAFDYSCMTGKAGMIRYEESYTELLTNWKDTDIINAEQEFTAYMLERNYVKAKNKLELIIGYYGYTDGTSNQLLKCRMFGLINLVLNAIEMDKTSEDNPFYSDLNPVQRLLQAATIQELKSEIMSIIETLILHYSDKEETTDKKLQYIDRYIEAHYMDHDLSVQQLAIKFKLSFSFLSKVYKQKNGIGVLEVINACRIRHAKELLLQEPELSLAQIAERVGYGNVQTMLRVFKKSEEQTPGQYRAEKGEAI